MSVSIPYNTSLALGNIIDPALLNAMFEIRKCQNSIEAARNKLNSLVSLKRSLEMTARELINIGIDTRSFNNNFIAINESILEAATGYATTCLEQEKQIQVLNASMPAGRADLESPVDFSQTTIADNLPLAADSMTMDVQYFSYSEESNDHTLSTIKSFIDDSTASLGDNASNKISQAATAQILQQQQNHELSGTLIISASCTHRNATLLNPLVLDIDKAIDGWNSLFPAKKIDRSDSAQVEKVMKDTSDNTSLSILSGATYGSSFVGMVHLLKKSGNAGLSPALINKLQEQFTLGKWMANEAGSVGVDPDVSANIRALLSNQDISTHITLITMGIIPSIKSKEARIGVKTLAETDTAVLSKELSVGSTQTGTDKTVSSAAASTQALSEKVNIKGTSMQHVVMSLSKIDETANQSLDINSLMIAFEDYTEKVATQKTGVPISYQLKQLTCSKLAEMWMDKYHPLAPATQLAVKTVASPDATEAT